MGKGQGNESEAHGIRAHESRPAALISGGFAAARSTWAEVPQEYGPPAAWVYSDERSYKVGETVRLFISGNVSQVDVRVYRDGARQVDVMNWGALEVGFQPLPARVFEVGCNWAETVVFPLADAFRPGAYIVEIRATGSDPTEHAPLAHHIFFVRAAQADPSALVLIASTITWSAYNDWGGANHYRGVNPGYAQGASPKLSTKRPWARGQVWLPADAPRFSSPERPVAPRPAAYPNIDWAYAHGYTRYYAAAGWASFELPFVRWAENAGYAVHVIAQDDLELNPGCLDGYKCAVVVGHDEYWSRVMRETLHRFMDIGGNVARFAANFLWQVRLEEGGTQQICYKYAAKTRDPVLETGPSWLASGAWEDPTINLPGAITFGVNGLRGIYAGFGAMAPRAPRGFQVFRPDHWAFEGTGLGYAEMFGDEAGIFAFEVDGLEYTFKDGLPLPTGEDGAPDGLEIIAMGWATQLERGMPQHAYSHFLRDEDAKFAAATLDGIVNEHTITRRSRGCGVVVSFKHGEGAVFCAASCEWVRGLMANDFYTTQITQNVLDRFLGSILPTRTEVST